MAMARALGYNQITRRSAMSLSINTNIPSAGNAASEAMQSLFKKLSSGSGINSAADNPAGLAIVQAMRADILSTNTAINNAQEGYGMAEVAGGALGTITETLTSMRELAMQSANGTLSASDRQAINQQFSELASSIDATANSTEYNGTNLLANGSQTTLQVGTGSSAQSQMTINIAASGTAALGVAGDVSTQGAAQKMLDIIDEAIGKVSANNASIGAAQNTLSSTLAGLASSYTNEQASVSAIGDTDYAAATAELVKNSLMQQVNVAVQAQANVLPEQALKLLQ